MPKDAQTTTQLHPSHTPAKQRSKFSKPGPSNMRTANLQMSKLAPEKAEEPEIKPPTPAGPSKKQELQKNIHFRHTDHAKAPDRADHNKLWKTPKEMGTPDHPTCPPRNLHAGQEATATTRHGTTDWPQTGKGARQGCNTVTLPTQPTCRAHHEKRRAGRSTSRNQDCRERHQQPQTCR